MKRAFLFAAVLLLAIVAFIGCHKDPIDFGNVGMLNLNLKRGYKTTNKSAIESFDARVTIYYSTEDTVAYNCRFNDLDGDGRYTNDPSELDCIYIHRDVGFWVGVWAVIQGDTVTGMSDPTKLLYLSEENVVIDIDIVLVAGYPRILVSSNTVFDRESVLLYGEVIEGAEMLEQYLFAVKRGQLSDEEKRLWSKRNLTDMELQELFYNDDYEFVEAEPDSNETNRFVGRMEMYDLDSAEYSVVALATLRMNEGDSVPTFIHSPVVSMTISEGGLIMEDYIYLDDPYWNGETMVLTAYYLGNSEVYECGFVYGQYLPLTDTLFCRETSQPFSYELFGLEPITYRYIAYVKTPDGLIESEVSEFTFESMEQEFAVYTQSATDVTESSATLNGYVTSTDGVDLYGFIINMGTYNDTLMVPPSAEGYFFSYQVANLTGGTTYYYQAFANRGGWTFGEEISFTTAISEQETPYSQPTGYVGGYGYVDLGLPSGTLWAYTNIGANSPTEYGNYYAWGETETKDTYDWNTYIYCNGDSASLTKYCNVGTFGANGFTDNLSSLESSDDAASVNWNENWRTPTQTEFEELFENCTQEWMYLGGTNGYLLTGPNGNSIFIPAAGDWDNNNLNSVGMAASYWLNSLGTNGPYSAGTIGFYQTEYIIIDGFRDHGDPVRPVCVLSKKKKN